MKGMADEEGKKVTRREFLKDGARGAAVLALGCGAGLAATRGSAEDRVWQIDPYKCIHCGNCATYCVLTPSAVKCFHAILVFVWKWWFVSCGIAESQEG